MLALMLSLLETREEREKMEQLYETNKKLMLYSAYQVLHDYNLAEDAVQNAFLHLIRNSHKIREESDATIRAFLTILARNSALGILRKEQRIDQWEDEDYIPRKASLDPIEPILERISQEEILEEIRRLPQRLRDVLLLKANGEFSDREIARMLQIPYSVLRKRLQRGREILAQALKNKKEVSHYVATSQNEKSV